MKKGMKVKVPVQDAWVGRAGSLPPPPAPLAELPGRGGMAGQVLPGGFEQGRGDLWQASRELKWRVYTASKLCGFLSRVNPAGCHGKLFWRVISAGHFGGSFRRVISVGHFGGLFWHIYLAGFHG
jgi:hypothetical protein